MHETLITPAGLERLTEELERLRTDGRREMADRIRHAISTDADASANIDYLAAREEQALLEARIVRLEQRIEKACIAEPDAANGVLDLGERVLLRDLESGSRLEYELVGSLEADPWAGRISAASPIGRALLGRRPGEVAVVDAPKGRRRLEILAVGQPAAG
jgi:transcription elongation factor GreA